MENTEKKVRIPSMKFNSNYFKCGRPGCDYVTDGPRLVKGNIAQTPCPKCGFSYLVRIE